MALTALKASTCVFPEPATPLIFCCVILLFDSCFWAPIGCISMRPSWYECQDGDIILANFLLTTSSKVLLLYRKPMVRYKSCDTFLSSIISLPKIKVKWKTLSWNSKKFFTSLIEFSENTTAFLIRLKFRLFSMVLINSSSMPSLMLDWHRLIRSIGDWYSCPCTLISFLSFDNAHSLRFSSNTFSRRIPLLGLTIIKSTDTSFTTASIYIMSSTDKIPSSLHATFAFWYDNTWFCICKRKSYSLYIASCPSSTKANLLRSIVAPLYSKHLVMHV